MEFPKLGYELFELNDFDERYQYYQLKLWELVMRNGGEIRLRYEVAWRGNYVKFARICATIGDEKDYDSLRAYFGTMYYDWVQDGNLRIVGNLACYDRNGEGIKVKWFFEWKALYLMARRTVRYTERKRVNFLKGFCIGLKCGTRVRGRGTRFFV